MGDGRSFGQEPTPLYGMLSNEPLSGTLPADTFTVPMHDPVVITDGGPWASHDVACYVCRRHKAVVDVGTGIFYPCDGCRRRGWRLYRQGRLAAWWRRRMVPWP